MDINSLPAGSRCLVDANILIYHLDELSLDCKAFLARVARREVEAHITTIIVAEVLHRQMLTEAVNKGVVTAGQPLKKLKANPHLISGLSDYISKVEKLLKLPLQVKSQRPTSAPVMPCAARAACSSTTRSTWRAPSGSASQRSSRTTATSPAYQRSRFGNQRMYNFMQTPVGGCSIAREITFEKNHSHNLFKR